MAKIYTATKSMNPWNVDDDRGWDIIGGSSTVPERELVPTVADCIDELGKGLADLPFSVYDKGGNLVDDSDDYKNVTGMIPDPYSFLMLTAASLVMSGQAYWGRKSNIAGYTKGLQYWAFPNVSPIITPETNKQTLKFRRADRSTDIPAKDVFYVWLSDARVEFGPPTNYPLRRALKAAGALSAISTFIDTYMNSGMVKAFIAQSEFPPASKDEKEETENYLTRMLTGVRRALSKIRVFSKGWTFTSIGGGLDELKNIAIVKEIKQDVLESFGVPASRVWGNAANYATAANDTVIFITSEIMPMARVIESAINEQLFAPYGYTLKFEPRRLEEFSVILGEKVKSLESIAKSFERAMGPAESLKASIDLLGLDLSPELIERIKKAIIKENTKPEPPPVVAPIPPTQEQPQQEAPQAPQTPVTETPAPTKAIVELDKWRLKSEKAGKLVTWHAVHLSPAVVASVKGGMDWDDARAMLTDAPEYEPATTTGEIKALADAINRAADMNAQKAVPMLSPSYTVNLTANMPQPGEPTITVNVPMQPAPTVSVSVPEQPAPVVTVTNEVAAPAVNVTAIPGESRLIMPAPAAVEIVRDASGKAKEIKPKG